MENAVARALVSRCHGHGTLETRRDAGREGPEMMPVSGVVD